LVIVNYVDATIDMRLQKVFYYPLLALLLLANACIQGSTYASDTSQEPMGLIVSTQWLSEHLGDPDLVVLDTTVLVQQDENGNISSSSAHSDYESGHIPTAAYADLLGDLSDKSSSMDFVMPSPEQFRLAIGKLGVGNDSRVVLYSANYPAWAARLWWMLRWAGFDQVALLDGGLQAWVAEDRPLSMEPATYPEREFTLSLRPEVIADQQEVLAAINNDEVSIIDAMNDAHYTGQFTMYDRPGHITSATNMPSTNLLDESGYFRSLDELEMMHDGNYPQRSITYCGGGVAASTVAFIMYRLGYTDVAVYMGSLQEWTKNPENPMTVP